MWLQCISRHSWQCPCISEVQVATQDARLKALECHYVSSNISSRVPDQDKGGMEKNNMLSLKGSLICLPGKSMIFFTKSKLKRIESQWPDLAEFPWTRTEKGVVVKGDVRSATCWTIFSLTLWWQHALWWSRSAPTLSSQQTLLWWEDPWLGCCLVARDPLISSNSLGDLVLMAKDTAWTLARLEREEFLH